MQITSPTTITNGSFVEYLSYLGARERGNLRAHGLTSVARTIVPAGLRPRIKSEMTRMAMPRSRRAAKRMVAAGRDIKLHFGCGEIRLDGWTNVDLVGAGAADFLWDLRWPMPFPDGSVTAIFHEHLLEHLTYAHAVPLLRESKRLLKGGGTLRIGVPDFGKYAKDYAGDRTFIESVRPGRPTALLAMAEIAYCYQHLSMWDGETLGALLRELGFTDVTVRSSGDSRLRPVPDTDYREPETVYVEAVLASGMTKEPIG